MTGGTSQSKSIDVNVLSYTIHYSPVNLIVMGQLLQAESLQSVHT